MLVCWRLNSPGRNLRHLILLLDELNALGVAFVSLSEGIDATTPAGPLQRHVLGAVARLRESADSGADSSRASTGAGEKTRLSENPSSSSRSHGTIVWHSIYKHTVGRGILGAALRVERPESMIKLTVPDDTVN